MNQIDTTNEAIETIDEQIEADGQLILDGMPEPIEQVQVTLTLEEIVEQVIVAAGEIEATEMTLYRLHTLVNSVLSIIGAQKDGDDYRVRSQMMYNYGRGKMVVKGRVIDKGQTINVSEARTFINRFCAKFVK